MNEEKLNELLEYKRSAPVNFPKSEAEFTAEFFSRIEERKTEKQRTIFFPDLVWRYAAGILLLLGISAVFLLPAGREAEESSGGNPYAELSEAVRLFDGGTAVLFVNDDLCTGERSASAPENLICLIFSDRNGKTVRLSLACADQDTILLNMPGISGEIVASRCDGRTMMLDIDLNLNGKRLRLNIPAEQQGGNCYKGNILS